MKLENWVILPQNRNEKIEAPDEDDDYILTCIRGSVHGDPTVKDGSVIYTSALTALDIKNKWARTKTEQYELGLPDPFWLDEVEQQGFTLEHIERMVARSLN